MMHCCQAQKGWELCFCRPTVLFRNLIEYAGQVGDWGLDAAKQLAQQYFPGWDGCNNLGSGLVVVVSFHDGCLQFQLRCCLSKFC